MTPENLTEAVSILASNVVSDPRWNGEADDLGVSILGMILYGYSLATGRIAMMLDVEHIDRAVHQAITTHVGSAEKWTEGLVEEAQKSSLNPEYHAGQYELVGVGHSYFWIEDMTAVTDNIFQNIKAFRSV